jgi:hypothetical protein
MDGRTSVMQAGAAFFFLSAAPLAEAIDQAAGLVADAAGVPREKKESGIS